MKLPFGIYIPTRPGVDREGVWQSGQKNFPARGHSETMNHEALY